MKKLKSILALSLLLLSAPLCFSQSADALFGQAEALLTEMETDQAGLRQQLNQALEESGKEVVRSQYSVSG
jgi:hypothetical protein